MSTHTHLMTWISRESKERFARTARAQGLSESALLRRLVELSLAATGAVETSTLSPIEPVTASGRISVRLRHDDLLLLRERAAARQLPTSIYVSYLVRSHLRAQVPLPTAELEELRRSVAEVGAIGRNINQIARAVNQQQWPGGPNREELLTVLKALVALRANIKALINANLASWDSGHADRRMGALAIDQMSWDEKLRIEEELWASLSREEGRLGSPPWHEQALKETVARYEAGQEQPIDWADAKRQLRKHAE